MQKHLVRPRVIVTADDFGRDESTTDAIACSLRRGTITATSIMTNAPCFARACEIARRDGFSSRIGVHLVLDEGRPLSNAMLPFTDSHGHMSVRRTISPLGRRLSAAVTTELTAQIEAVLAAGIRPTHLDSHRHIHTAWPIGRVVVTLAQRYGIPYVRRARNLATRGEVLPAAYKWMFSRYVAVRVRTSDYFADIIDFYERASEHGAQGVIELMTHLDDTPRGLRQRQLLEDGAFRAFIARYDLVGHADVAR